MNSMFKLIGVLFLTVLLASTSFAMTSYGPTKKGDTTWRVAKHFRVKDVSMDDLINAIQSLNPSAFGGPNNVTLALGQTLKIPTTKQEVMQANNETSAVTQTEAFAVSQPMQSTPAPAADASTTTTASDTLATAQPIPNANINSDMGSSWWSWLWFILFVIALGLYVRSRWLVKKLRMTHHIVTHRLGMGGRRGESAPKEVSRYNTLGMKPRDPTKMTASASAETKIIGEVSNDMAAQQYDAAEKKLLNAIRQNKMNLDLRMKLLDVYVAMNNQSAFSKQAEYLLKHMISENDDVWARVRNMYLKKWVYDE